MNQDKIDEAKFLKIEKQTKLILVIVCVFLVWEVFDNFWFFSVVKNKHSQLDRVDKEFSLLNPTVVKKDLNETAEEVKGEIEKVISQKRKDDQLLDVGVYFRDLDTGYGFGVNEHAKFVPASLLKMPTMIAYYKLAEKNPDILNKELIYVSKSNYNDLQTIKSESGLIEGQKYTVENLIEAAVKFSDNNANIILVNNIDPEEYLKVFREIGIQYPDKQDEEIITPKSYANLYRILYNATYLSKENSQKALNLLTESTFNEGLVAGLNGVTKTADKFGERIIDQGGGQKLIYLHDCGIVYTKHPYSVCVMTKGRDMQNLKDTIKEISGIVFKSMKY